MSDTNISWFKSIFTDDSSVEDIIDFIKNVFELEKHLKFDIVKTLESIFDTSDYNFVRIDVKDAKSVISYILKHIKDENSCFESFLNDNNILFKKYNINIDFLKQDILKKLSLVNAMQIITIIGQKRNYQMLREKDLYNVVKIIPSVINKEAIVYAELINELSALCVTKPSKSEINIQINSIDDVCVSIDTVSMINNLRENLKRNPALLNKLVGKTYNIEITSKLANKILE